MSEKLWHISWLSYYRAGGVEKRAWEFAQRSSRLYSTRLLGAGKPDTNLRKQYNFKLDSNFLPLDPYSFGLKQRFERYFIRHAIKKLKANRSRVRLVHGQGVHGIAGIRNNIPTVVCWHGLKKSLLEATDPFSKLWQEVAQKADHIFCNCQNTYSTLSQYGVSDERLSLVYNGVNPGQFKFTEKQLEEIRTKYYLSVDKRIVMTVSNMEPKKRILSIVKTFESCSNTGWILVIVGAGGSDETQTRNYVNEKNLPVLFLGQVQEDLPALYNLADLFVLNSTAEESFGIVLLEAMAAGLPIISSKVGAAGDILDQKSGFFHEEDDQQSFRVNLESVLTDKTATIEIGLYNKSFVQQYSWDKQFEIVNQVYTNFL